VGLLEVLDAFTITLKALLNSRGGLIYDEKNTISQFLECHDFDLNNDDSMLWQ
jgi:hypothetical protein